MTGVPNSTPYDMRFRMLGIPVRVHPLFWLIAALLGGVGESNVRSLLIWVGCVFVSVLVHEFGHALMARIFGFRSQVLLYGFGGVCQTDYPERQSALERLAILVSGPGAGFMLAGLAFGLSLIQHRWHESMGQVELEIVGNLLRINILWGLVNLLPIWPLDGGQISGVILGLVNRGRGRQWTHVLSMLAALTLAFLSYRYTQDFFLTAFFAYFAMMNFQVLQLIHQQARYGAGMYEGDAEWWRR